MLEQQSSGRRKGERRKGDRRNGEPERRLLSRRSAAILEELADEVIAAAVERRANKDRRSGETRRQGERRVEGRRKYVRRMKDRGELPRSS